MIFVQRKVIKTLESLVSANGRTGKFASLRNYRAPFSVKKTLFEFTTEVNTVFGKTLFRIIDVGIITSEQISKRRFVLLQQLKDIVDKHYEKHQQKTFLVVNVA